MSNSTKLLVTVHLSFIQKEQRTNEGTIAVLSGKKDSSCCGMLNRLKKSLSVNYEIILFYKRVICNKIVWTMCVSMH